MRRSALLLAVLALAMLGCQGGVVYVPGPPLPPPIVIGPEPEPPPPPPPPPPADELPGSVQAVVERIAVGASLTEASIAVGFTPAVVPEGDGTSVARWLVTIQGERWMVFAVLDSAAVVTRRDAAPVRSNP